jgi:MHS family proline/betaine transporter-like MFS transporter
MPRALSSKGSVFWAAVVGNLLEYYDFTVYVVFTIEISKAFFPSSSNFSQIWGALMAFAFGFLARPLGGVVLGYVGDRFGRRTALLASAIGMTSSTFAIGVLPNYETIGFFSILLLCIFRLIQGFCISGEGTGAAIFILEHSKVKRLGLMAGIVHSTNMGGTLLAIFVSFALKHFFPQYQDFIWRFAFIFGGLFGLFALFLRWHVAETPIFAIMKQQRGRVKDDIMSVVRSSWHKMFLTFVIGSFTSSMVQFIKGYIGVYYQEEMGLSSHLSLMYLMYNSVVLMISMMVFGGLGDIFGKSRILIGSGAMAIIFAFPALWFMSSADTLYHIIGFTILDVIAGAASASAYAFVISIFEPSQRFFGVSVSYNLGIAIFGGTSPAIAKLLLNLIGDPYAPAYYIIVLSILFLISMFKMKPFIAPKDYH